MNVYIPLPHPKCNVAWYGYCSCTDHIVYVISCLSFPGEVFPCHFQNYAFYYSSGAFGKRSGQQILTVRVGNQSQPIGDLRDRTNNICSNTGVFGNNGLVHQYNLPCKIPFIGQYVSLEIRSKDSQVKQVRLCEVAIY